MTSLIATLCLTGQKPKTRRAAESRHRRLMRILGELAEIPELAQVAALLLPGGCYRLPLPLGRLDYGARRLAIAGDPVGRQMQELADGLAALSPGALLITGLDTVPQGGEGADQSCIALGRQGIVGYARKIFPANGDTNGEIGWPLVCWRQDYDDAHRLVRLRDGRSALLAACYDVFGVAEALGHDTNRLRFARALGQGDRVMRQGEPGFADLRRSCFAAWSRWLIGHRPDLVLAAIHSFDQPGRDLFWQRHGIATASAALGGALVAGASHYRHRLPDHPARSSLAARTVPRRHLHQSWHRKAHGLETPLHAGSDWVLRLIG